MRPVFWWFCEASRRVSQHSSPARKGTAQSIQACATEIILTSNGCVCSTTMRACSFDTVSKINRQSLDDSLDKEQDVRVYKVSHIQHRTLPLQAPRPGAVLLEYPVDPSVALILGCAALPSKGEFVLGQRCRPPNLT